MRGRLRLLAVLALGAWGTVSGCRRGDVLGEAAEPVAEIPIDPWAHPAPDSLYGAPAVENLRVVEAVLEARGIPRGWDGMRIAVVSDLLIGAWRDNARVASAALQRAVEADPDLIVLLGNFAAEGVRPDAVQQALGALAGRPTLAVLGVRDVRSDTVATAVASALRGRGVNVLRNEATGFARGGDTAYIVGIEPVAGTTSPPGLADVLATIPEGAAAPLLLSNLATVLPNVPEDHFQVVLSGNTFCGDVEVPGTPRFQELAEGPLANARVPRATRLFRANESVLFVTCGTGYSFVPARWASPPEVAIITLLRLPDPRPAAGAEPEGP
jgi:uncharacterized protein